MTASPAWLAAVEAILNRNLDESSRAATIARQLDGRSLRVDIAAVMSMRVDVHAEPIGELRRVFDVYRPAIPYYNLRQVDARVPPLQDWLASRPR